MKLKHRLKQIDEIYAGMPTIKCKGLCQECCGPILMSKAEWQRIIARLGFEPEGRDDFRCPMLCKTTGQCTVYDIRPLICRLWGLVREMACPFGCEPTRWIEDPEARQLLAKMQKIGG